MVAAPTAADAWTARRRRTRELRVRRPFALQVLDLYGALLPFQEKAAIEANSDAPALSALAAYVAEVVVPSVLDVTEAVGPEGLRAALASRLETVRPRDIIERWIRGQEQPLVERYLARASLGPVLEGLGPEYAAACGGKRDARHCPRCGGPPQLSYFAPAGEDLAAGPRRLQCARCHAEWGYARMTCPGCGETSSARLSIFSEEGTASGERGSVVRGLPGPATDGHQPALFPHMRIDACETCRRYVLSIDLVSDPHAVPEVDELAAIPLDLVARERGFSKITPNVMGF